MSYARRLIRSVSFASVIVLVVTAMGFLCLSIRHEKLLSVKTASMAPTFKPGDAIIVRSVGKEEDLATGTVITFHSPDNSRVLVTHRLVEAHGTELVTSGDALGTYDKPIKRSRVVGAATAVLPGFGRWLDRLQQPIWLLTLIYLPTGTLVLYEWKRLFWQLRPPPYRAFGYR